MRKLRRPVKRHDRKNTPQKRSAVRPAITQPTRPPLLRRVANAEDAATGQAFEVFQFRKPLGRSGIERLRRAEARNPGKLVDHLVDRNWTAPLNSAKAEEIAERAIRRKPLERWLYAAQVGWTPDLKAYVLPTRVVGQTEGPFLLKPPLWLNQRHRLVLVVTGSLKRWINRVARPARFSSRLMLVIAATFAAPLLHLLGYPSFVIVLFGRSKAGKSTTLLAGASGIGIGRETQLPNLNTTDAAFLETARLYNDSILPGNELGLIKGQRKDAYTRFRHLIYAFAEGSDTARHSGSSFATDAVHSGHRGIMIVTAEHSSERLAELAGEVRDHGELARCTDVPATTDRNKTVFDRRPRDVQPDEFEKWARKKLVSIREACAGNAGVAIAPYLKYIIALGSEVGNTARDYMAEFHAAVRHLDLSEGALQHAAGNFAVIYAGGRFGIDAEILPWTPEELLRAIVKCFEDALHALQQQESLAAAARRILHQKLTAARFPTRDDKSSGVEPAAHEGFIRRESGTTEYVVHSAAFREWFPTEAHVRAALLWLHEEGHLILPEGKTGVIAGGTEWAVTSPRWKGEKKVRSFAFRDPFATPTTGD